MLDGVMDDEVMVETETTALVRVERAITAVHKPRAMVDISGPEPMTLVASDADYRELVAGQLYLALYNMSGEQPYEQDYLGNPHLTDEELRRIGQKPRSARYRALPPATPMKIHNRLALAPIHRVVKHGEELLTCRLTLDRGGWVTHLAIGTRHGIVMAGQFLERVARTKGNGFTISLRLTEIRPALETASARRLTSVEEGSIITSGGCDGVGHGRERLGDSGDADRHQDVDPSRALRAPDE